jgi:uncharacterized metal-binding protein YceD (DUF177 family)
MSEGIIVRNVPVTDLPARPVEVEATAEEKRRLADAYDLREVRSLSASVTLEPIGGGIAVEGRIVADIVQTCVVSLVPVDEHIDEPFEVRFVRDPDRIPQPGSEIVVDPEAEDPPELLEGNSIDIGALVEEYFALAINPYPRAPGAELPAEYAGEELPADKKSPFAALAALADPRKRKS